MISIDTNWLLYARNSDGPRHQDALAFITDCASRDDVLMCELVLVELYVLLRNPAVLERPLAPEEAAETCRIYRTHPRWRLIEWPRSWIECGLFLPVDRSLRGGASATPARLSLCAITALPSWRPPMSRTSRNSAFPVSGIRPHPKTRAWRR